MKRILGISLILLESFSTYSNGPVNTKYAFPNDEYEHYMQIIQRINPDAYSNLLACERLGDRPCINNASTISPGVYRLFSDYPSMVIPSLMGLDLKQKEEVLEDYTKRYNEECRYLGLPGPIAAKSITESVYDTIPDQIGLAEQLVPESRSMTDYRELIEIVPDTSLDEEAGEIERVEPEIEDEYAFPRPEYEHYLKIIKRVNPLAYERLIKCAKAQRRACIEEAKTIEPTVETNGDSPFPDMIIRSLLKENPSEQEARLRYYAHLYNSIWEIYEGSNVPITQDERDHVLRLIKSIAPEAYEGIVAVDPTGEKHIVRFYESGSNAAAACSKADGWPVIYVTDDFFKDDFTDQQAAMGHELGHYILGHVIEQSGICDAHNQDLYHLDYAYRRVREYEADRAAVLDFGIDPQLEIKNYMNRSTRYAEAEGPSKATFTRTHPLDSARAKQFTDLDRDIELRKRHPVKIDWPALASEYKASGECIS